MGEDNEWDVEKKKKKNIGTAVSTAAAVSCGDGGRIDAVVENNGQPARPRQPHTAVSCLTPTLTD